jgi:3-hydroxyacyl-CoA dehydrogenase
MGSGLLAILPTLVSKFTSWYRFQEGLKLKLKRIDIRGKAVRNRLVNEHLGKLTLSYLQSKFANRITTGNTTWHGKIATVDWIISSCWRLDIKLFFLNKWRNTITRTLITSNMVFLFTLWVKEEAKISKHFCGTHFLTLRVT